jgi:hypothetical protein
MIRKLLPALLLAAAAISARAQESRYSGFELTEHGRELPVGWAKGIGRGTAGILKNGVISIDQQIKHGGGQSVSIELHAADSFASIVHTFARPKNARTLRLKAWMKTQDLAGVGVVWMRADGANRTVAFINNQRAPAKGSTDWTEYVIEMEYDKDQAKSFCYGAYVQGNGKIWVDDFTFEFDGKAPEAVPDYNPVPKAAESDTSFSNGSGIASIPMNDAHREALANLGAVWGFLKYYHPEAKAGKFNMDVALFRVLPELIAAKDLTAANAVIERWVDGFGKPAPCKSCKPLPTKDVAQMPDYGRVFDKSKLPASLIGKLEYIRDNRGETESYYVRMMPNIGNPEFRNEREYGQQVYPDAGLRLLALYRYWNMIRYFFPYQHLIGEDWNKVLPDVIPEFAAAKDTVEYQRACLKLIARIHDTHAGLWGNPEALRRANGRLITPFQARFLGDQLVVTGYYKDTLGIAQQIRPGDIIDAIDGVPVAQLVKQKLGQTPASNYATQLRDLAGVNGLLLRGNREQVSVHVRDAGKSGDLQVRCIPMTSGMWAQDRTLFKPAGPYRLLNDKVGYIYPAMLSDQSLDSVKTLFKDTKGIVVDLRCYPTTFMPFTYGAWLKRFPSAFAKFTGGSTDWPGLFQPLATVKNGGDKGSDQYNGKLVIIVDATTQSQAEYTAMALQTVPGAVTIGSTTAGADGNVSDIILPGGLRSWISGIGVLYPDGTETQRSGVTIDKLMQPTPEGIRAGRDELLEAAVKIAGA